MTKELQLFLNVSMIPSFGWYKIRAAGQIVPTAGDVPNFHEACHLDGAELTSTESGQIITAPEVQRRPRPFLLTKCVFVQGE